MDVETLVVGAGHSGLIVSHLLSALGREHVVVDRRTAVGGGWQDRWDAFQLVTPNAFTDLPGFPYDGPDPDGYMAGAEVVDRVRRYAEVIHAPLELGTDIQRLWRDAGTDRFRLETSRGSMTARDVVVAAGSFHVPNLPAVSSDVAKAILQLHSHHYRRPEDLPPGGVLVIGSGQTGVQLAEELFEAGRAVTLSVGHCWRSPRRYRGRDTFAWVHEIAIHGHEVGVTLPSLASLPSPRDRFACNPHVSGHHGGHDTNLRRMAFDGIRLAGRLQRVDGTLAVFASNLRETLAFADHFFDERQRLLLDRYIEATHADAPPGEIEQFDFDPPELTTLDLAAEGISTILWTTGYRPAFGWIDLPIFDADGLPRQVGGVTEIPGLTFIGMLWQVDGTSANLAGVARDAIALARHWERPD